MKKNHYHIFCIVFLCLLLMLLSAISSAIAVTPPPPSDDSIESKPEKWRIFTPWKSGISSKLSGCGYNNDDPNKPACVTHTGQHRYALDFNPTEEGQEIYAIAPGRVVYSREGPSTWGKTIVIEHHDIDMIGNDNFYYSQYSHLSEIYKNVNSVISAKNFSEPIGREGKSGNPSFPVHLHFELHSCPNSLTNFDLEYVKDSSEEDCKQVIAEPMIGDQVYEGFSWLYRNAPNTIDYYPRSWRPDNYNYDVEIPGGNWASEPQVNIHLNDSIVWDINYHDNSNIKEIRATIYYKNWPGTQDWQSHFPGLNAEKVWFIVASCNPSKHDECENGYWQLKWNPWQENQISSVTAQAGEQSRA